MRQSLWDKRLPTFLGLLIIGISLVTLTSLVQSPQLFELGATSELTFEDIVISNQTGTSLSVSFRTKEPVASQLRFGQTLATATTIFDDRDEIGQELGAYNVHHFTLENLSPTSEYRFAVLSKSKTFDNNGIGFPAKTASVLSSISDNQAGLEPVRGTVVFPSGVGVDDALVFVTIQGATVLSTVVKSQGNFFVPLTDLSTSDLTGTYSLSGSEVLSIEVIGGEGTLVTALIPFDKHTNLGQMIVGKNVDLTENQSQGEESSGFQQENQSALLKDTASQVILNPQDGDFVLDAKPLFRGKSTPLQKIEVIVESDLQEATVTANTSGDWSYQPDVPLSPGRHTVSVRFFDGDTATKILQHNFEVLASGSQVEESATPSVSPTVITQEPPTAAPIPKTATVLPGLIGLSFGILVTVAGLFALNIY